MLFQHSLEVKMSDGSRLLMLPETECSTVRIKLPRNRRPKHWDNIDNPVDPLERNLYGLPLAGLFWDRRWNEVSLQESFGKGTPIGNFFLFTNKQLFLSVYVDDQKMAGRTASLAPLCSKLKKKIDFEEPTPIIECIWDARNVNQ